VRRPHFEEIIKRVFEKKKKKEANSVAHLQAVL
jgi:hypothetical protein